MDLFSSSSGLTPIPVRDGELGWMAQLPLPWPNEEIMALLVAETAWRQDTIVVYGKTHLQPRLSAWHGDKGYRYSGLTLAPLPFTPLLETLRRAVESATGRDYNSVLLNYYRDGRDSMGMHSDDEAELGPEPAIASLSFGAARSFVLRHKRTKETLKLPLGDGSLLFMASVLQSNWLHGINKTARPVGARLNLTFRKIV